MRHTTNETSKRMDQAVDERRYTISSRTFDQASTFMDTVRSHYFGFEYVGQLICCWYVHSHDAMNILGHCLILHSKLTCEIRSIPPLSNLRLCVVLSVGTCHCFHIARYHDNYSSLTIHPVRGMDLWACSSKHDQHLPFFSTTPQGEDLRRTSFNDLLGSLILIFSEILHEQAPQLRDLLLEIRRP